MPHGNEDIPLRLNKRQDGTIVLRGLPGQDPVWPLMHEFEQDRLLEYTMNDTVKMSSTEIVMTLANGRAVYKIRRDLMEDDEGTQLATGYWGELVESDIWEKPEVDPRAYAVRAEHDEGAHDIIDVDGSTVTRPLSGDECEQCNAVRRQIAEERSNG